MASMIPGTVPSSSSASSLESLSNALSNSWSNPSCCIPTVMVYSVPFFRCFVIWSLWDFASLLAKEYFFGIRNGCLLLISILASTKLGPPLTLATLCLYPPPPFLLLRVFDGVTLGGPWRYWLQLLFFRRSFPCQLLKLWLFRRFPRPFACWFPFCILKCGCSSKHRLMVCVLLPQWVHRLLVRSFFFLQYSTSVWPPTCCSSNSV